MHKAFELKTKKISVSFSSYDVCSNQDPISNIIKKVRLSTCFCCHLQGGSPYSLLLCPRPFWWRLHRHNSKPNLSTRSFIRVVTPAQFGSVASVQTGRGVVCVQERLKCVPRTARFWADNIKKEDSPMQAGRGVDWVQEIPECIPRTARSWAILLKRVGGKCVALRRVW